jgi:hypothetical protein
MDKSKNQKIAMYLDDEERGNATYENETAYHEWKWTGWAFGTCNLTIVALDTSDNSGTAERDV